MKRTTLFTTLASAAVASGLLFAQDVGAPKEEIARALMPDEEPGAPQSDAPVRVPPLKHYARLWTESLFTTRAIAMPDAPAGPNFTDNLTLSGTFEEKGKLTAILIDRTTSNIIQVYIGEDNAEGFRISKVEPGPSPDKMRLQLQKGNQAGWVSFGEAPPPPAANGAGQNGVPKANSPLATRPPEPVPAPAGVQIPNPLLPPLPPGAGDGGVPVAVPQAVPMPQGLPNDPPLPPQ